VSLSKLLDGRQFYELDPKVLRIYLSGLLGEVDGGGFASVAYAMRGMRIRAVVLGHGRHPMEGDGRSAELSKVHQLRSAVLASILSKGNGMRLNKSLLSA
jgi:hypothetical protein